MAEQSTIALLGRKLRDIFFVDDLFADDAIFEMIFFIANTDLELDRKDF